MKKTTFAFSLALMVLVCPGLKSQTGTASGTAGGSRVDFLFPAQLSPGKYATIPLPDQLSPVGLTDDGTVILREFGFGLDRVGYRWKEGRLSPLSLPGNLAGYSSFPIVFQASRGGWVMASFIREPPGPPSTIIFLWPPGEMQPLRLSAPPLNLALNPVLNAVGSVWAQVAYPVSDDDFSYKFAVWNSPFLSPEVLDPNGDAVTIAGVNASGVLIGTYTPDRDDPSSTYDFVGDVGNAIDFEPRSINDAGWVVGLRANPSAQNILWKEGKEVILPDGDIDEIDQFNNLHGHTPDGKHVMWTTDLKSLVSIPIGGIYRTIDYIPPVLPEGWTSDVEVIPGDPGMKFGHGTYRDPADPQAAEQAHPVLLAPAALGVDADRDGQIDLAGDSDRTSADKPFRFWINDDIDREGLDSSEAEVEDDDDPGQHPFDRDWMLDHIPCARDLEDFARLWISTQGLNAALKSGDMKLGLKWTNITRGAPAVKLYCAASTDGGTGYLLMPATAQQQIDLNGVGYGKAIAMAAEGGGAATTLIEGANGFIFPTDPFASLTDAQSKTYFLFEGCKTGAGRLQLVIYDKSGTKIGDGPGIYLDLKNIKEMYERWTVGDGPNPLIGQKGGGDPAATAAISSERLPSDVPFGFQYGPQQTADDKNYILFVHGWNMPPWVKDAWAETMLKRLYWQGYKGRFGTFQWPTTFHDWSVISIFDFDQGEYTAWRSARPLAELLKDLNANRGYTVSVLAHSLGNVVAGEALQIAGRLGRLDSVRNYVATQAAVSGHCFDGSLTGSDLLSFGFFGFGSPETPNIYRDWFYLSSLVVRTQMNFYNVNDYALSAPIWQTDQTLKPNRIVGITTGAAPSLIGPPYGYSGDPSAAPVKTGFFKTTYGPDAGGNAARTGTTPLSLEDTDASSGSVTNLRDRYEIMAFASESRSKALGGVATVAGFDPQNLQNLWPPDTFPQTNGPYSFNPWHSAQFRFTNADQANYWNKFMKKLGLPTTQ